MTPAGIKVEAQKAGLPATLALPTVSVAGKSINNGARARAFASYMRIHTLEATGDLTYAQMGRYTAKPGTPAKFTDGHGGTNIDTYAAVDPNTKQPVANGLRDLWVTETALTTALNTSYMAEQLSLFGIVVGIALLLAGIGFAILAIGGALRTNPVSVFSKRLAEVHVDAGRPDRVRRQDSAARNGRPRAAVSIARAIPARARSERARRGSRAGASA